VNHAAGKAAFGQQLELQADMVGEGLFAGSHDDGRDEQVKFVDGQDRLEERRMWLPSTAGVPVDARSAVRSPQQLPMQHAENARAPSVFAAVPSTLRNEVLRQLLRRSHAGVHGGASRLRICAARRRRPSS
jgi:hypothetical protein